MVEIIAIDGPASVGKSTLAKKISNYYEVPLLNSGRLYRAVALKIIDKKININNKYKILQCAKFLTDENLRSENLFSSKISNFIDKTVWALNGRGLASTGPDPTEIVYPYEQILNWGPERDIQKFRKAWVELNKKHERTDRSAVIFTITSSADHKCGVVLRYPSYKAMLTSNAEYAKNNPSWQKDWQTYLKENGGGQITRNFSRILLKEW